MFLFQPRIIWALYRKHICIIVLLFLFKQYHVQLHYCITFLRQLHCQSNSGNIVCDFFTHASAVSRDLAYHLTASPSLLTGAATGLQPAIAFSRKTTRHAGDTHTSPLLTIHNVYSSQRVSNPLSHDAPRRRPSPFPATPPTQGPVTRHPTLLPPFPPRPLHLAARVLTA